ncbi:hypothetical protein PYCCODRAFT_1467414 [Trametes coccinea BRFM310]|uniref:Uncharacterized protein n=1 Tax=Trametes coccinea (strain BRFM310) TaxID=1353009 RepID=A0A1Y2IQ06_TRAC3|nr:hypothetical protein PYCCODRAFT_1467414 [Trametes coccinea BRFM310]
MLYAPPISTDLHFQRATQLTPYYGQLDGQKSTHPPHFYPSFPPPLPSTQSPSPVQMQFAGPPSSVGTFTGHDGLQRDSERPIRAPVTHPYACLNKKKQSTERRRKMFHHVLEKAIFAPHEIASMGSPHRRTIYTASLEAHIDRLHEQLLSLSLFPVAFGKLQPYHGLNSKTAKSMVSGLHHDGLDLKLKICELERANRDLEDCLLSLSITAK